LKLRDRAREFLQAMLEAELDEVLERSRYTRRAKRSSGDSDEPAGVSGHRHGQIAGKNRRTLSHEEICP
jgi:hypothetical protein